MDLRPALSYGIAGRATSSGVFASSKPMSDPASITLKSCFRRHVPFTFSYEAKQGCRTLGRVDARSNDRTASFETL
jgi:hypothetical protein